MCMGWRNTRENPPFYCPWFQWRYFITFSYKFPNIKYQFLITISTQIAVVAVMCKPHRCPHISMTGNICVYCPGGPDSDFEYSLFDCILLAVIFESHIQLPLLSWLILRLWIFSVAQRFSRKLAPIKAANPANLSHYHWFPFEKNWLSPARYSKCSPKSQCRQRGELGR